MELPLFLCFVFGVWCLVFRFWCFVFGVSFLVFGVAGLMIVIQSIEKTNINYNILMTKY